MATCTSEILIISLLLARTVGDDVKLAFLDVKAFERLLGSCIERMEKNCAIYLKELAHSEGRQNV